MPHYQAVKLMGQSKYYMVIFYGQQLRRTGFYPLLLLKCSALRTMPVPAAVILILYMSAPFITAAVHMVTQG
jgi:hypothetical protein